MFLKVGSVVDQNDPKLDSLGFPNQTFSISVSEHQARKLHV